ncbi:hypothetical protein Tco_0980765 [Tanacetum coccineum]
MIQPEPEDLPKDNPKLEIAVLRDKVGKHVYHKIGNGKKTSVWYDKWHEICPLDQFLTNRDIYDERFTQSDSVADLIEDGRWKWFNNNNDNFEILKNIHVPNLNDEVEDVVRWKTKEEKLVKYSTGHLWRDLNSSTQKVPWKALMWFSQCMEFFLQKIQYDLLDVWSSIVPAMIDLGFKNSIDNITRRLILRASVYMIWKERNTRLFQKKKHTEEVVIKQIKESIKTSLMSLIVKDLVAVRKVKAVWNVKMVRKGKSVASL